LKLSSEGYSPGLLKKIEYAGGNGRSFATAAQSLERLAEFSISAKHVERLTERLGKERAGLRDKASAAMQGRTLRSSYKQPPAVAVISVDAGKAQFRRENKGPGVHQARWGDTKVACLQTYTNVGYDKDPKPDPPEAFLDPQRVERLCREMERVRGTGVDKQPKEQEPAKKKQKKQKKPKKRHRPKRPQRLVRTVVATTAAVEAFGWMVSAEAMQRKMYAAKKRAVIGDGGNWIDPLEQMHFPDWVQVPAPAGALVRGRAAGVRTECRCGVEVVRADAAGCVGRARAAGDRHAQVAVGADAGRCVQRQGRVSRRGVGDGVRGAEPAENGLPALPAAGAAGEQRLGRVADQADQSTGQGNRAVLEHRRLGSGLTGSRGVLEPGRP
jgi:hypothetical protein